MQHAAHLAAALFTKNTQRIVVGFARVDDDRLAQLARETHLAAEDGLLHVARREVVVVVEADFADGPRRRRGPDLLAHQRHGAVRIGGELVGLMRMDADRESHLGPEPLQPLGLRRLGLIAAFEDDAQALESRRPGARHDRVEIVGERVVGQVAVGIDHFSNAWGPPRADALAPSRSGVSRTERRRSRLAYGSRLGPLRAYQEENVTEP